MALIDRIKFDSPSDTVLVWKYPRDEIRLGAQLIVNETQTAVFFKNGKTYDTFEGGRFTLSSKNIPLLNKIINLPFGGETPFAAEVWFVNRTEKRDLKWGTSKPIPVIDSKFNYPINVRAFGSWGIKVTDPKPLLEKIVGTQSITESDKIESYFEGLIIQRLSNDLATFFTEKQGSIFNANAQLNEFSDFTHNDLQKTFSEYGIQIVNFEVQRVSIPDEDMKKFQDVLGKKMEVEQLGQAQVTQNYTTIKSFDVMEKAAENEGGVAGGMMAGGLGIGMGMGAGVPMGQQVGQNMNAQGDNKQSEDPMVKLQKLKQMLDSGLITEEDYNQHKSRILGDM